jgi:hypothetical protein
MNRPVELFSLEAVALWIFTIVIGASGTLDFLYLTIPRKSGVRRWVVWATRFVDRFFKWFYRSAKLIPWVLAALLISVLAPIYDMHTDIGWADAVLSDGGDRVSGITWTELLLNSHVRTLPTFIHVAQTAIVLAILWLYSILWCELISYSGRERMISLKRGNRWQFMAGFVAIVVAPTSKLITYLGEHSEIAFRLPQITA